MKYSFKNDYSEGCHPRIIEALAAFNLEQQMAYGGDRFSETAAEIIKQKSNAPHSKVFFVSGGTQANLIIISSLLRPHESIVAATSGHIFTNEAGAIEATGHKVHGVDTQNGKLAPEDIQKVLEEHTNVPHQVKQKLVYISNSTEIGSVYSHKELQALSAFCKEKNLYLFMDGARLGHALTSQDNDVTLEDIAKYTDVFYLGGTKNGALIGEAIVINTPDLQDEFGFHLKQKGALLAKGRLLGIQFQELLKDDLYWELARYANEQAHKITNAMKEIGAEFLAETQTNQVFPILTHDQIEKLSQKFDFYVWKKIDEKRSAIRMITSWATQENITHLLCEEILNLKN